MYRIDLFNQKDQYQVETEYFNKCKLKQALHACE